MLQPYIYIVPSYYLLFCKCSYIPCLHVLHVVFQVFLDAETVATVEAVEYHNYVDIFFVVYM